MGSLVKTLFENPAFAEAAEKLGYIDSIESARRFLESGVDAGIVANSLGISLSRVKKIKEELEASSKDEAEAKV